MTRPAVFVYGNCQADAIAAVLRKLPDMTERFDIVYAPSFVHPIDGPHHIDPADLARCRLLIEQRALRHDCPFQSRLPADCLRVDFPMLAMNAVWPLQGKELRNTAEPEFPFGRYPYGDRMLNRILAQGFSGEAAFQEYRRGSIDDLIDLDRFVQVEHQRIRMLDERCSLKLGAWVMDHFRTRRLFWTYNHPTSALLAPLVHAVAAAVAGVLGRPSSLADCAAALFDDGWEPADWLKVAVHPVVAARLDLQWCGADLLYSHYRHRDVDYRRYWLHQIAFD